jgi:hypothetical protein
VMPRHCESACTPIGRVPSPGVLRSTNRGW